MNKNFKETIKADTDKQYEEMFEYIANYTGNSPITISGSLIYRSQTEKIIFDVTKNEVIIKGKNQENINEMKKHLEYIVESEKRSF